jgi:hypothetical protein
MRIKIGDKDIWSPFRPHSRSSLKAKATSLLTPTGALISGDIFEKLEFPPRSQFRRPLAVPMEISLGAQRRDRSFCLRPLLGLAVATTRVDATMLEGARFSWHLSFRLFQQYPSIRAVRCAQQADLSRCKNGQVGWCCRLYGSVARRNPPSAFFRLCEGHRLSSGGVPPNCHRKRRQPPADAASSMTSAAFSATM